MILEINAVPEGRSFISRETGLESVKADLPAMVGKFSCKVEINRFGSTLYVVIGIEGTFELECSRCLQPYKTFQSGETRVIIKEKTGQNGVELDEDGVDFYFDVKHDKVDLCPAIYDEIMTNLPLKPLCKPDCKGIEIDNTVKNISFENNNNSSDEIDPRWEALKKLKENRRIYGST